MDDPQDRCPRCGAAFHCGVRDAAPCACGAIQLAPELQTALRRHFSGCLCQACLRALAAGAPVSEGPAADAW